jgi:hypothetical protein
MTTTPDFLAIEIDDLDAKLDARLAETAKRKRIPSLRLDTATSEKTGGRSSEAQVNVGGTGEKPIDGQSEGISGPEPTHRPGSEEDGLDVAGVAVSNGKPAVRRKPLSIEVPEYLARELKVKAATEGVTVRFLVLRALVGAGYRVDGDELEEDGRRLR